MKNYMLYITLLVILSIVFVVVGIFANLYFLIGCVICHLVITALCKLNADGIKEQSSTQIKKIIDSKIWNIPVKIECCRCQSESEIIFDFEKTGYVCNNCDTKNKILMNLIAVEREN